MLWHVAAALLCVQPALAQQRVPAPAPLGDPVETPLLPAGISRDNVEMFGELVYLWTETDGSNVIHFVGDFELQMGQRRLYAREAVIWMTPRSIEKITYLHFELLLWRDARVVEPAGTTTRGPALFATFDTAGDVESSADKKTFESSADHKVYQDAVRIRQALATRSPTPDQPPSQITVFDLGRQVQRPPIEVRPAVSYQGRDLVVEQREDRNLIIIIGDVYVYRGDGGGQDAVEIRADAAVVYLAPSTTTQPAAPVDDRPGRGGPPGDPGAAPGALSGVGEGLGGFGAGEAGRVEGVYLEGDIVLSSGDRMIRASRLYYDFVNDRALILDAVVRMFEPGRGLPLYLRADSVRQLSATEFSAKDARITTSEFHTPHYHIGAEELELTDQSPRGAEMMQPTVFRGGAYKIRNSTFNISGTPILFWPYSTGNIDDSETSLKSVRSGYSGDFGVEFQSRWELFNLLGLEKPPGFDSTLRLDYFSERGPAAGVDIDYETDDSFGLFRGYYVHDTGKDNLGGRFRSEEPDTKNRGRATFRHREYLPDDWQLTLEFSYISDRNFMEEWFEPEFDQGKEQETLIYLKKQVDNWAFTAHLQYQILDFVQTTERMPEFSFFLIGEPVGDFATYFSENHAGLVRYRAAERTFYENLLRGGRDHDSGTTVRGDTRHEIELPFAVGDFKIVPFGSVRDTYYDDTPESGSANRYFGTYGLRGSYYAWKVYPDLRSELFDVNGIRHIIKGDVVAWAAHTNHDSNDLFNFDENIDQIDEVDGVSIGVRQRFQTKRGAPGKQRNVDLLTLDLELGVFNDAESDEFTNGFVSPTRPENSVSQNYLNASAVYRVNDSTDIATEINYDINDGEVDILNLTYAVERSPRLSYLVGYRYIGEIDSNLLGLGLNYRISEKYILAVREEFDLERGRTAEFDVGIIRKFPRWYVGLTFALDEVEDDFGVSISAWPEGLPSAAMGSRRFTGLTTSTGIRPGMN